MMKSFATFRSHYLSVPLAKTNCIAIIMRFRVTYSVNWSVYASFNVIMNCLVYMSLYIYTDTQEVLKFTIWSRESSMVKQMQ